MGQKRKNPTAGPGTATKANNIIHYSLPIEKVKNIPIIDVFNRYIDSPIKMLGSKGVASCPFHGGGQEQHPSLILYLGSNSWYCFGCQLGGSNIDLVMETLKLPITEAVKVLAADFGITTEALTPHETEKVSRAARKMRQIKDTRHWYEYRQRQLYKALVDSQVAIDKRLREIKTVEELNGVADLLNASTYIDYLLDILIDGTELEKLEAYRAARGLVIND